MPVAHTPPAIVIKYVGGPTTIIEVAGLRFLTDPTFSAPAPYRSGSVVLEKTEKPALSVDETGRIDAVLLSHDQHADNLDPAGRALVANLLTLTTVAGAQRLGGSSIGLGAWESREFLAPQGIRIKVTATPARHGPAGIESLLGDVTGFVISSVVPPCDLIYITGDTVWFHGTAEVAKRFDPAAVLLFAGAARTRGPFHLTMDTNDAVEAAAAFPRAAIIPVHHSGWAHFTQSQDDIIRTFTILRMSDRLRPVSPSGTIVIVPQEAAAPAK
jgi:L-ascorbate metabolism protein UlaG (beta-lactamase superfamily)